GTGTGTAIVSTTTLSTATGNEVAWKLNYTTNKAAGNDTGIEINMTDTASPGTSYPFDIKVGGASKMHVDASGYIVAPLFTGALNVTNTINSSLGSLTAITLGGAQTNAATSGS
ncbi:MAG TPA: hypothetical protein PL001_01145, partial [Candidatus Kryptobacter bacterium]|nr:hypothetical protein [Candidatus Kryptobacter bacterium]